MIKLKDNNNKKLSDISEEDIMSIKEIAGKTISAVKDNVIIFPNSIKERTWKKTAEYLILLMIVY